MKFKNLFLFVSFIAIFSCNIEPIGENPDEIIQEEENEETNDNTLVKKIVYYQDTDFEYTEIFNYDGNKLTSIDGENGDRSVYTYEGDNLVREDVYFEGKLAAYQTLEYNNDGKVEKLVEYWLEDTGVSERTFFHSLTYNDDNTISVDVSRSDMGSDPEFSYSEIISFDGLNISNTKQTDTEYVYAYDDKNGMFKNIYKVEVFNLLSENEFGPYILGNSNNIISDKEIYDNQTTDDTYEYIYNDKDYPISAIGKRIDDGVVDEDSSYTINFYYE